MCVYIYIYIKIKLYRRLERKQIVEMKTNHLPPRGFCSSNLQLCSQNATATCICTRYVRLTKFLTQINFSIYLFNNLINHIIFHIYIFIYINKYSISTTLYIHNINACAKIYSIHFLYINHGVCKKF